MSRPSAHLRSYCTRLLVHWSTNSLDLLLLLLLFSVHSDQASSEDAGLVDSDDVGHVEQQQSSEEESSDEEMVRDLYSHCA